MKIFLYLTNKIYDYILPEDISGSFSFDPFDDENKLINIEAEDGRWVIYSTESVKLLTNSNKPREILECNKYYVLEKENKRYLIYVEKLSIDGVMAFKCEENFDIQIGSDENCAITYNCEFIKDFIMKIFVQNNQIIVSNKDNKFVYVNKIYNASEQIILNYGDELNILGLKIIFLKDFFMIMKNDFVKINDNQLIENEYIFPKLEIKKELDIKDIELYKKEDYFFKSPRIRRSIEKKEVEFSTPPKSKLDQEMPFFLVLGPMLTMGIISVVNLANTILRLVLKQVTLANSWSSLIVSAVMLLSTFMWPFITRLYQKKLRERKLKETIEKYLKYLDEKKEFLKQEQILQKSILLENLINVDECLKRIEYKNMNFWDKRVDQNDFLSLKIGIGDVPLEVDFKYKRDDFSAEENEIKDKIEETINEYKNLKNVPVAYSFYENKITAIMGNKYKAINFLNNIILQILTFYSYEDVKISFFTNYENKHNWDYLKYVNHCFSNDKNIRFFSSDSETAKNVAEYLEYEISLRKAQSSNNVEVRKPYYVIITDDYEKIKRYSFVDSLTELNDNLGFSLIILENRLSNLPSKCNNFINLGTKNSGILKKAYEEQEQINFTDQIRYDIDMMDISRKISNIPVEFEDNANNLVNSISFLEMEKVGKVEQLNIMNRWNSNDPTQSLRAEIGVEEHGDLMYLDLHEKHHGPHGLIAGMTGSGKSEFIITYILSMAINYSPDYVSFILIDYKGGGLAFAFENKATGISLPHLAGTITNLDKAEMDRTLVSIDSEIKRRQEVFNRAREILGENTIDIYKYQKYYKEGRLKEAIPHLFIICDEFAELKSQQPDFMDNLISVARIGRSLGVHLILATQKPSGVVNEQIWSNSRFRVCLKVQDENDSSEVLKRKDAAYIKQTGRFFLQVGFNEYFALGQSAWCGAKYYPSEKVVKNIDKSVNFINDNGFFIKSIEASNNIKITPQGEQIAAIIKSIIEIANKVNKKSPKLWLDNIPDVLLEDDLRKEYNVISEPYNVKAVIGKYDAPEIQKQGLVEYDFLEDGNTIIYGVNGIEKEMILNEIIYSSTKNHSVDEINYYIIDYGSESLGIWNQLPHVGGVIYSIENEEYRNLFKLIREEFRKRKKLFSNYGGDYKSYIKSQEKLPLKVIIINNFDSVYESNADLYDELPELVRDSARYGIIYILTANAINSVHNRISQNFNNIYAFKLKDSNDYYSLFNIKTKLTPKDTLGRGILNNGAIHEFQTASIVANDTSIIDFINEYIKEQKIKNTSHAEVVPTLPEVVSYNIIKNKLKGIESIPIGISKSDLEIVTMNFLDPLGNIITSNKLEDTKYFVLSVLGMLNILNDIEVYIIDPLNDLSIDRNKFNKYYCDDFDNIFTEIINTINDLIDKKMNTKGVIIIYGVNKLISKLEQPQKFTELLNGLSKYENIGILIIEEVSKLKKYTYESWFNSMFDVGNGLWIGRGLSDQSLLRVSTLNKEMSQNYKKDMGYLLSNSQETLCRLIDFTSKGEADNEK